MKESLGQSGSSNNSRPSSVGGTELVPDLVGILRYCSDLGEVYLLSRNVGCIIGSATSSLAIIEAGNFNVAAFDQGTATLLSANGLRVFASLEQLEGGWVDSLEFCDRESNGAFKVCRLSGTDRFRWLQLQAIFHKGAVGSTEIGKIRRSNLLEHSAGQSTATLSSAGDLLKRFFLEATRLRANLDLYVPSFGLRLRSSIAPNAFEPWGGWLSIKDQSSMFYLLPASIKEVRITTTRHLARLVLLGDQGQLIALIVTRQRKLVQFLELTAGR